RRDAMGEAPIDHPGHLLCQPERQVSPAPPVPGVHCGHKPEVYMDPSTKQIEHHGNFVAFWNRLLKILIRWLFIYPAILIIGYEAYHWLKFGEFLGLDTYKIAPPRLVGFLYNLTRWEGANILIYNFLQLPIFITIPV